MILLGGQLLSTQQSADQSPSLSSFIYAFLHQTSRKDKMNCSVYMLGLKVELSFLSLEFGQMITPNTNTQGGETGVID
jgi:hypothetical protein